MVITCSEVEGAIVTITDVGANLTSGVDECRAYRGVNEILPDCETIEEEEDRWLLKTE